jgi:hypothetical protein
MRRGRRPATIFQEAFEDGALTLFGASRRSGLPYAVLVYAVHHGTLPVEKRGHRVAIDPAALQQYLTSRTR